MFLTGEFSRIARISKRMLQHYDRIGLFSPENTDPQTGYRYYSAKQLPRLNRILALKDLGLTLEQVQRMIDKNITVDEIKGMLLMQKAELEQQLYESLERIKRVESRLARLSSDEPSQKRPEVILKSVNAQRFLALRRIFANLEEGQATLHQLLTGLPSTVNKNKLGNLMSIMYSPEFELDHADSELGYIWEGDLDTTLILDDNTILTVQELPEITLMATVVQVGRMDMLPLGYEAITEWVEANDYRIIGAQREIYLEIPTSGNPDDLVTEIQFPIEKYPADRHLLASTI